MEKLKKIIESKYIKIIFIILFLTWCIVIFLLSHQQGNDSGSSSLQIIEYIINNILSLELDLDKLEYINSIFRTFMHGFVYFVLSFLMLINCSFFKINNKYFITIIFTLIYSITDEIHQHFIPGRFCDINDIIVDQIGNISAVIVFAIIQKIINNIYIKKKLYLKEGEK